MIDACTENWPEVEEHLKACKRAYADQGSEGYYLYNYVIMPLVDRFGLGERTRALAEEIMSIAL
jgi:hypothetical protein